MISRKEWKKAFLQRLLEFAVAIIKLANKLPKTPAGFAIATQLIKAGTAIGANAEEAQDASSLKDFIQKLSIALREARETCYWLKVISKSDLLSFDIVEPELKEGEEIVAMLSSSVKSSKMKL